MRAVLFAATLALVAPMTAMAQTATAPAPASTRAVLADPAKAPSGRSVIIDGATWRCDGASCSATGGSSQPAARACRRVVTRFGAVTEFSWKGETLDTPALAACNA